MNIKKMFLVKPGRPHLLLFLRQPSYWKKGI
jgi:hypothetical protein